MAATGEAAGDDLGVRIVDGSAEWAVAEVFEGYDVTRLWVAESFFNFGGINPFMSVKNACARCDNQACHGGSMRGKGGASQAQTKILVRFLLELFATWVYVSSSYLWVNNQTKSSNVVVVRII